MPVTIPGCGIKVTSGDFVSVGKAEFVCDGKCNATDGTKSGAS